MKHQIGGYEKAFNLAGAPVRGLWRRQFKESTLYYVRLRVPGQKHAIRRQLTEQDGSPPATVARAVGLMNKVVVSKADGNLPLQKSKVQTVKSICARYLAEGCPGRGGSTERAGATGKQEVKRVEMLMRSPIEACQASALTAKDWEKYAIWRKTQLPKKLDGGMKGRGGDRAVDKERITLSNAYNLAIWETAETGIKINQVIALKFKRYRNSKQVVHCRSHRPRTGDELHKIAREAFNSGPRSEVLGWFALFAARTGHREEALLTLRMDAKDSGKLERPEPGYVGNGNLYLFRSETSKGTIGHLKLDAPFQEMLKAHWAWHRRCFPESPWYFPSPYYPEQTIQKESLTHWLKKICPRMNLGHRTTHGLRSFRATCLRSQGKSAAETAELLGQKTAGQIVNEVYAEALDREIDFMPSKGEPAWKAFN